MESSENLRKTVLTDTHLALGAKMAPFGGYLMPIQYEGIIKEHFYTRQQATIFDTCHMGEFSIKGGSALADLEKVLTCPVGSMQIGQCRYGFICNEAGGVLDDQIIYRMGENEFFMVVNASTQDDDFAWVKSHMSKDVQIENLSAATAKIDLQGPACPRIMQKLVADPIDGMKYFYFRHTTYRGRKVLISRTGYTGEIGFEFYCDNDLATQFWNDCMELGAKPAGLGCRDTLRLEIGMPLYGHELSADRNAAESGLSRSIATDKQFIGSTAVLDKSKTRSLLVGIELQGRRASRNGDTILNDRGEKIGAVTSGSFSPSLEKALALGYVSLPHAAVGTQLKIDTGRQTLDGTVVSLPFYKNATGRGKMAEFL
jgi:aminomethyltransferase